MKTLSRGTRMPSALFVVIIFVFASGDILAQPNDPCACAEVAELINRLNMAIAGANTVERFKTTLKLDLMSNEISESGGMTIGEAILLSIARQQKLARNDSTNCSGNTTAATPYERPKVEGFVPLHQFLRDLGAQFQREIADVLRLLSSVRGKCRPHNWFGTITISEEMRQTNFVKNSNGSEETTEDMTRRYGTISFNGKAVNPFSSWEIDGKYMNTKTGGGTHKCTSSSKEKPDKAYKTKLTIDVIKSGGLPASTIEVQIGDPEGSEIPIGFMIPAVDVLADGKTVDTGSGACPNDTFTKNSSMIVPNFRFDGPPINFKAKLFRANPEKLSGTATITLAPKIDTPPAMTMTHTATVRYTLYRMIR